MKSLQLNLAKKLIIKDYKSKEELDFIWQYFRSFGMPKSIISGKLCKPLLKGTFLTEENLKESEIIETKPYASYPFFCTIAYQYESYGDGFKPGNCAPNGRQFTDSFLGAIKSKGWYWLENSIEKPNLSNYHIDEEGSLLFNKALKEWKEAESRTLRFPIIFEILE